MLTLPAYVPGRRVEAVPDLVPYKLSSNENPYPPLPSVRGAVTAAVHDINRYPDPACTALTQDLATHLGVGERQLSLGTGSVGVLQQAMLCCVEPKGEVVFAWRSFEAYPILTTVVGGTPVRVPLTPDGRHDLDAMAAAVNTSTRMILLCSPNNPTGPALRRAEVERFLSEVPAHVPVVLDEAYVEFIRDEDAVDGLALLPQHPNLVVLRTFSKAYGLAGLRVGYAVADERVAAVLRSAAVPFGVSGLGQVAARASLATPARAELFDRVSALVAERDRVATALADQGWAVPPAQGNFVWLPLGERSGEFTQAAAEQALAVRGFGGDGVRVSIGEAEANSRFLQLAAAFAPPGLAAG